MLLSKSVAAIPRGVASIVVQTGFMDKIPNLAKLNSTVLPIDGYLSRISNLR